MINTKNLTADFNVDLHVNDYTKNIVNTIRVVRDKDVFTQVEKDFVIQFLVNTLDGLTHINIESRQEGAGFYRMCDAQEVMTHLTNLYDKNNANELDYSKIGWQFTLQDSADALLGYDTEYRDCITEQFDDACNDACTDKFWQQFADADFTTLAARIFAKNGYSCYE
tara:strand:- start:199 stop:699 length:501 start_codon:yes stop_codon:yes gene_type:complete